MEREKKLFVFGEDYGTSFVKFGPVWLGEKPDVVENRGYFPRVSRVLERISGLPAREVVVGPDVSDYLETREDLSRLIYPMRHGVVPEKDEKAWKVVKEVTRYALLKYAPKGPSIKAAVFEGFWCVSAIAAQAPRYMYERIFDIHREINEEEGGKLVKAVTVIPQPLAVAIAHKAVSCVVVEGGHGNTQITPISRYVIRGALIPLNRGGSDANRMAAQILRDAGYGDLAVEEHFVRQFKEAIGLVPLNLDKAIEEAKKNLDKYRAVYRVPGTDIEVDLGKDSWQRFLIGEYIFNPAHELFESYYARGFSRPRDTRLPGEVIPGTVDLAEAVTYAVRKCPIEIQPRLYRQVILSGGNFAWSVPRGMEGVAVDSATKLRYMLAQRGVQANVKLTDKPQYGVWQGAIVYGLYVPAELKWDWNSMEGWVFVGKRSS